jgi:hypothetical protein
VGNATHVFILSVLEPARTSETETLSAAGPISTTPSAHRLFSAPIKGLYVIQIPKLKEIFLTTERRPRRQSSRSKVEPQNRSIARARDMIEKTITVNVKLPGGRVTQGPRFI